MTKRTYSVREARSLAGIGKNSAYEEIRQQGTLCGVPVIHAGVNIIKVPKAAFDAKLDGRVGAASGNDDKAA